MQDKLIHIEHENLLKYMAIAVECEQPHVSFLVLEEIPGHHFLTLKQLTD